MPGLFNRLQEEITHRDKVSGLSPVDLLDMADGPRQILLLLVRQGELSLPAIAAALSTPGDDAARVQLEARLAELVADAFVVRREQDGQVTFRTAFGQRRRRDLPLGLWSMLEERVEGEDDEAPPPVPQAGGAP